MSGPGAEMTITNGQWRMLVKYWPSEGEIPPCLRSQAVRARRGPGWFGLIELG